MIRHQETRIFFRCCRNTLLIRKHAIFVIDGKALKNLTLRNNRRHIKPRTRSSLRYCNLIQQNVERLFFIASDFIDFILLSIHTYSKCKRSPQSKANIFPHTHLSYFVPLNLVYNFKSDKVHV